MSAQESRGGMLLTTLVGLVLTILPLPGSLDIIRPAFLVLIVLYWSIAVPRAGGIGLGFFAGLALDVFQGPVLGEHAFALALVAYIAVREHQRIRSKPIFQQSLIVFAVLVLYELCLFAFDGLSHHPVTNPLRWLHTVTGALLWSPTAAILSQTTSSRRSI
jgi:rod shape-determining protein MreD